MPRKKVRRSEVSASSVALDLDALYGQSSRPRHVTLGGEAFALRSLDSFGPIELMQFQKLVNGMKALPKDLLAAMNAGQQPSPKQRKEAERMVGVVDQLVAFVCPGLPLANLPFAAKLQVVTFFMRGAEVTPKKVVSPRTGAGSTRGLRSGTA